jgi:hypothetical protein
MGRRREERDKADMRGPHVSGSVEGRVRGAVLGCADQAELGRWAACGMQVVAVSWARPEVRSGSWARFC